MSPIPVTSVLKSFLQGKMCMVSAVVSVSMLPNEVKRAFIMEIKLRILP